MSCTSIFDQICIRFSTSSTPAPHNYNLLDFEHVQVEEGEGTAQNRPSVFSPRLVVFDIVARISASDVCLHSLADA